MEKEQIGELLSAVKAIVEASQKMPRAVSFKTAAILLDVKPTKLKQMVRIGTIEAVRYDEGSHPKIPMTEIERLTTPRRTDQAFSAPKMRGPRRLPKRDVESELEKLSGILKKKRRG